MPTTLSRKLVRILNNLSPEAKAASLGTRLQEALTGDMPNLSVSTAELADDCVTNAKIGANAVQLTEIQAGLGVVVSADSEKTTSREENVAGLSSAITLANALKTTMNAHAADGVEHGTAADATNFPISAADATDATDLITLVTELLTAYDAHEGDSELGAAWVFHNAQEAGDVSLASAVAPTTLQECITRLNDLKTKFNSHDADATAHTVGSAHQEATANAAYGAAILVSDASVATGDFVQWGILDSGTGTVTGVSAAAGSGGITFTFSGDPQNDAIINYMVCRFAT